MTLSTSDEFARQMMALHAACPEPVALFDDQDVLRYANEAFCQTFHVRPDGRLRWIDLMRANLAQGRGNAAQTADEEAWLAAAASRRGKQPFRAFEADLRDGRWIWMSETTHADGWMLCSASDISALKADGRMVRLQRDQALRAAQSDPLTGISNRRHVLQQLDQRLSRLRQQGRAVTLVMLDLDHFKAVNDTLGHDAGDAVIRDFARLLQKNCRRDDGCGRMGGEEFILVLSDVGEAQALAMLDRLQAMVRQSRPLAAHPERSYSFSAGMAMARAEESAAQLCKRADLALYQAKAEGRDRCCVSR